MNVPVRPTPALQKTTYGHKWVIMAEKKTSIPLNSSRRTYSEQQPGQ
jgi:hypothetical protein